MGISRGAQQLLAVTYPTGQASGRVITFGVQKVDASDGAAVDQEALFRGLGFDSVESIDVYDAEKPTYILDLNRPVPAQMHGQYDLVYDGGTLEHCFNPAEALSNAARLVKPGGRVIHHVPINNWVDHGFYQFSPTLFFDFYETNGFGDLAMAFHFMAGKRESYVRYERRDFGRLPYSFGGKAKVLGFFTARKLEARTEIAFPIQGRYRRAFGGETDRREPIDRGPARLARSWRKRSYRLRAKSL